MDATVSIALTMTFFDREGNEQCTSWEIQDTTKEKWDWLAVSEEIRREIGAKYFNQEKNLLEHSAIKDSAQLVPIESEHWRLQELQQMLHDYAGVTVTLESTLYYIGHTCIAKVTREPDGTDSYWLQPSLAQRYKPLAEGCYE